MASSRSRTRAQPGSAALLPLFDAPVQGKGAPLPGDLRAAPGTGPHIGIDEAGRGCLAGPVVAAAVIFPPDFPLAECLAGLHDSKQLSEKKRDALAPLIRAHALAYGIGFSWQREIDRVNILNATFRAMSRACHALHRSLARQRLPLHQGDIPQATPLLLSGLPLFIDGNHTIPPALWQACTPLGVPPQRAIIDGDALEPAISAASILAKTVRDALMLRLHGRYPGYGFARHKGYGTKAHLDALAALGPCRLHRLTFRKVRPDNTTECQGSLLVP